MSEETKVPYYLQMAPIWAEEMRGKKRRRQGLPEKERRREWEKHKTKTLDDYYIKRLLRDFGMPKSCLTDEIIELERLRLKTKRLFKNKSK